MGGGMGGGMSATADGAYGAFGESEGPAGTCHARARSLARLRARAGVLVLVPWSMVLSLVVVSWILLAALVVESLVLTAVAAD